MFFNKYPYTDFHELNLSWVIATLTELDEEIKKFVSLNAIKYADPIQWNITKQYETNTVVIDPLTGTAYISVQPVPSGVALTNTDYWTVVFDLGSFVVRAAKNFTSRYEEETTLTATFPSVVGDWLVWGDVLYKVISPIVAGDQYVPDSNIEHFTMEDLYHVYLDTVAAILEMIGDLDDLQTIDKSSLVNAINEIATEVLGKIGDLDDLQTSDKTSIVNAINSVVDDLNDLSAVLDGRAICFDTVANMIADVDLSDDDYVVCAGYYSAGDCEPIIYHIVTATPLTLGYVTLDNGLYADLIKKDPHFYNIKHFGVKSDDTDYTDLIDSVVAEAVDVGDCTVYFPAGTYKLSYHLHSLQEYISTTGPLVDLHNVVILGDGKATLFHGDADIAGQPFDVFNLNRVENVTLKDFSITETFTGVYNDGANGVSIVNGCKNVIVDGIEAYDLPYYVGVAIYGGKGVTVQNSTSYTVNDSNGIVVKNCYLHDLPFGFDLDSVGTITYSQSGVVTNNIIENCSYIGIAGSLSDNYTNPVSYDISNNTVRNCKIGIAISRGAGWIVSNNVITSDKASYTEIFPTGITGVCGIYFASNNGTGIIGNIIDYEASDAYIIAKMLANVASTMMYIVENVGKGTTAYGILADSNSVVNSRLFYFKTFGASTTYHTTLTDKANHNDVDTGTWHLQPHTAFECKYDTGDAAVTIGSKLGFLENNESTPHVFAYKTSTALAIKQDGSTYALAKVFKVLSSGGTENFGVLENGALLMGATWSTGSVTGTPIKLPVYDATQTLIGYIPIYPS